MFDSDVTLDDVITAIAEEGHDPDLVLPLYDLLAESAAIGVRARSEGDMLGATIAYGRVSGIFDTMLVLGVPVPASSPAEIMDAAAMVLGLDGPADEADADLA